MSDEKTTKVYARLTRDFPQGQTHRRGGLTLGAGPQPVEAQVTDEQLAALNADPMVELVGKKEVKKWADRLGEAQPPTSNELADKETAPKARDYEGDETSDSTQSEGTDDGSDESEEDEETGEDDTEEVTDSEGDETSEDISALTVPELKTRAKELGVEDVDSIRGKQALIEAIENAPKTEE